MNTRWVRIYDCHDCKQQSEEISESTAKLDEILDVSVAYRQREQNEFKCPNCGSHSVSLEADDAV